jgi:uncharacterized membrane protein
MSVLMVILSSAVWKCQLKQNIERKEKREIEKRKRKTEKEN